MRKFTLFLSLMVAMVTTAVAQIDVTKEYYLKASYSFGMNSGYLVTCGNTSTHGSYTFSGTEKVAFKFTTSGTGYTLSRDVDMGGMAYTEYASVASNGSFVETNAMSGSVFEIVQSTSGNYNVKVGNKYLVAKMDGTNGYFLYVGDDATEIIDWTLEEAGEGAEVVAAPVITDKTPAADATVTSLTEVVLTFDKKIKTPDMMQMQRVKIKAAQIDEDGEIIYNDNGTIKYDVFAQCMAYSVKVSEDGLTATCPLTINKKLPAGDYIVEIEPGLFTSEDGGTSEALTYNIKYDPFEIVAISPDPANTDLTAIYIFTLTFSKDIDFVLPKDDAEGNKVPVYINIKKDGEEYDKIDLNSRFCSIGGTKAFLNIGKIKGVDNKGDEIVEWGSITEPGVYTLEIPAGVIKVKGEEETLPATTLTFNVVAPAIIPSFYTNPEGGKVSEINTIIVEFLDCDNPSLVEGKTPQLVYYDSATEQEVFIDGTATGMWNTSDPQNVVYQVTITFPETTEPNWYSLFIPEGMFDMDGTTNEESWISFQIVKPVTIKNVTPENGTTVEKIEYILVEYSEDVAPAVPEGDIFITDANGNEYKFTETLDESLPWTTLKYVAETPITAAGTYTLNTGDISLLNTSTNEYYNVEGTYSWTIADVKEGIDGVDAEDGEQVIYDLTGRRVYEITEAGIYIVNGKKVLVK